MNHIGLPRGCFDETVEMLRSLKIEMKIIDERFPGIPIECQFQGMLRPEQEAAGKALLMYETGVLAAATAFGKTVVAAKVIVHRAVNTRIRNSQFMRYMMP